MANCHKKKEDSHHMHFSARGMTNKKYSINHGTSMRSTTPRNSSFLRSPSHTTDDDKYKGNNNNYCNERTKSWTDHQRAPEPFSSPLPTKKKNNGITKKKYGYGDLFNKSSSNGSDRGDCMSVGSMRSKSTFGSDRDYRRKEINSYTSSRGKSDNRIETQESIDRRRPSFTRDDFPLLSPTSKQKKSLLDSSSSSPDRQSSWSAVVGKNEKDNVTTANDDDEIIDGIPHLPLYAPTSEETAAIYIDANQVVSSDDEEEPIQASKAYWQQSQQRQRAHSFHHYSSSSNRIKQHQNIINFENKNDEAMYHPFSSFTTMSISALQNDIGTLLARSNRVDEAIKRYKLSIESARAALDEIAGSFEEEDSTNNKNLSKENHPQKKCPKVTEAEGLAWFRQKLLRGDMAPAPIQTSDTEEMTEEEECDDGRSSPDLTTIPFQPAGFGGCAIQSPRRLRSASFSVADLCPTPSKHKLSMPRIGQANSIDQSPISPLQPSKISRNTSHPVTAPHPGKSMLANFQPHSTPQLSRTRSSSFHHRHPSHTHHSTVPSDDIVHDIHVHQKLDCPDEVYSCQGLTPLGLDFIIDPIPVLGSSLRNLVTTSTGTRRSKILKVDSITLIAARLNLASLEYRKSGGGVGDKLQQVLNTLELALEDCLSTKDCNSTLFCQLKAILYSNIGIVQYRLKKIRESISSFEEAKTSLEQGDILSEINFTQSNETHDDNRIPPQSYLLLVIRLNLSRVSCQMNKLDNASKFCKLIAEDNKPHRRNSSRRSLSNTGYQHTSFRRSNSFSATSSALDTAMAAYDHDIDRRAKWLSSVAEHYITGLVHEANGEASDYKEAWHHYNRLLSLARVKFDHRHVYICTLLERRGAVLFEQRNLGGSMLSYLACMKILEHQQSTGSNIFNEADLGRILYAIGRVLHDNDEYHDAIHMYNRALVCQRNLASVSGRPSLDVITTLCNICRVHHLSGEIDAALAANREVLDLALMLVGGKMEHPFLINRLKIEGNILVEAGRLDDAMNTFVDAARRCSDDQGRDEMMSLLVGGQTTSSSQEDADNGDSSVLSTRSAAALALEAFHQHAAAA